MDKWLWYARIYKTRSIASKVVKAGYLKVNGIRIKKASASTKQGDKITFPTNGQIKAVKVLTLADKRLAAKDAVKMYAEL